MPYYIIFFLGDFKNLDEGGNSWIDFHEYNGDFKMEIQVVSLTLYNCHILQAPSWLTMHGPIGVLGVQLLPKSLQSEGSAIPLSTLSQIHAERFPTCLNSTPNFFCAS